MGYVPTPDVQEKEREMRARGAVMSLETMLRRKATPEASIEAQCVAAGEAYIGPIVVEAPEPPVTLAAKVLDKIGLGGRVSKSSKAADEDG